MTPELRLLLSATKVVTSPEDKAILQNTLTEGVDWTRFARKAVDYGLADLAGAALASAAPDLVPDDILDAFRMSLDRTRRKNLALFDGLAGVIEILAKEGI